MKKGGILWEFLICNLRADLKRYKEGIIVNNIINNKKLAMINIKILNRKNFYKFVMINQTP